MGTVPSAGAQRQSTKNFSVLIEPIRTAGITIHITIGNHDTREKLWKLLPFLKKEQIGVHADVLELPHANLILLDSGKRGILEDKQLELAGSTTRRSKGKACTCICTLQSVTYSRYTPNQRNEKW